MKTQISKFLLFLIFLVLILMLFSCGASYHLKKADHHIKKAMEKGAVIKDDTVFKTITIKTQPIKVEFEPKVIEKNDTVYYEQKILTSDQPVRIKIIYRTDSTGHTTAQPIVDVPETKHTGELPIGINRKIERPPNDKWKWIGLGFFGGIIITLLIMMFITRSRR